MNHIKEPIIVPFLKWAGGKRWLTTKHAYLFPTDYNTYIEPFLGSGAVYFYLQPKQALLSDANEELIGTYIQIRDNWAGVQSILQDYQRHHNKDFYYDLRSKSFKDPVKRAARFLYLNRTCWNGLYRVNMKGKFNVPIGTKNTVILDTDNFEATAKLLQNAKLCVADFQKLIDASQKGDFLFVDPPYTVKHNLNGFVKYNEQIFSWEDQIRLRDCIDNALIRGVKILLTNADHDSIKDLYSDIGEMESLHRASVISGNAGARGKYSELIVKCY